MVIYIMFYLYVTWYYVQYNKQIFYTVSLNIVIYSPEISDIAAEFNDTVCNICFITCGASAASGVRLFSQNAKKYTNIYYMPWRFFLNYHKFLYFFVFF